LVYAVMVWIVVAAIHQQYRHDLLMKQHKALKQIAIQQDEQLEVCRINGSL